MRGRFAVAGIATILATLGLSAQASAAPLQPFGHSCQAQNGVRFCPTADRAHRVPTFDGVPLDVDVTLPQTGNGPFPTHRHAPRLGRQQDRLRVDLADRQVQQRLSSPALAYAVRQLHRSGLWRLLRRRRSPPDHSGACGKGYIRLADSRYEARDTQYLLGKLADEGITKPQAIGVTGVSYGGGQSMELAFLHNQIRLPNGQLAPWRSPDGKHMSIAAAYPALALVRPRRRPDPQRPLPRHPGRAVRDKA